MGVFAIITPVDVLAVSLSNRPDSSVAEHSLGKGKVEGPIPSLGSKKLQLIVRMGHDNSGRDDDV